MRTSLASPPGWLARRVPLLDWGRRYSPALFRSDLVAGLTVAVMLIPQAMAYAALAGMPPVTGLYASMAPLLVYAVLGTSGQLAVGPVAITALLTASGLAPLAGGDPGTYVALAALLALMVGVIQGVLGVLRLGALVNFMSHAVISGFTSAAAIVIATSQVPALLGLDVSSSHGWLDTVAGVVGAVRDTNPVTLAIAGAAVLLLAASRRWAPSAPSALLVVAVATAAVAGFGLDRLGVDILREIPAGLPSPAVPPVSLAAVQALLPTAMTIAVISYMEGISVAKAIAAKTRQVIDADQELIATGAANVAAGLFQSFPVAGGFSRTAVNYQAGARTGVASAITAAVIAVAVLAFTPLFFSLPRAVLAAVIVVAVVGLIDVRDGVETWRVRPADGATLAITFAGTLLLGVELGIAVGVAVSLGMFVWRTANPHAAELGRVEGTTVLRNIDRYPARTDPQVVILRIDGPLYFANAKFVEDRVLALSSTRPELRHVVLDAAAVSDIDASGAHTLAEVDERLIERQITLHLATVRGPVRDVLTRADLLPALVEQQRVHRSVDDAVGALHLPTDSPLRAGGDGERAPAQVL